MQGWSGKGRRWLLLALGVVVVAAALGGFALTGGKGSDPPAAPAFAVVQRPRGLLYKAMTARFEEEAQQAEPASRADAAEAFASAELQYKAYRYGAATKEYQRSLRAVETPAAHLNAGLAALNQGELGAAEGHFGTGLERIAGVASHDFVPAFQMGLGVVYRQQGRISEALEAHREALEIAKREEDLLTEAAALGHVGNLHAAQGNVDEAVAAHERALELGKQLDHAVVQAVAFGNLGYVHAEQGLPDGALAWYRKAYRLAEQRLGSIGQAYALADIGNAYRMRGQIQDALLSLGRALGFHVELGNPGDRAAVTLDVGDVYFRQGQLDRALASYEGSFRLYRRIEHPVGQAAALSRMGNVYERQRQLDEALAAHERALELHTASGHAEGRARDLGNIGNVYGRQGRMEEALERLRTAEAIYERVRPQGQGAEDVARTLRRLLEPLDLSAIE